MVEQSLTEIDWESLTDASRSFFPSPAAWEDQVLYFLMLDRFSDGKEKGFKGNDGAVVTGGETPPFQPADNGSAITTQEDARNWREAGATFVGGTLRGLGTKLGYLKRLGVTAVWVSPVFKQVVFQETYHGYGVQHFLDVDPHFGTRENLREMVKTAHDHGICVILDVILNHSGNVFGYDANRYPTKNEQTGETFMDPRWDGNLYEVKGYHDHDGIPSLPFERFDVTEHGDAFPDGAIWPHELQEPTTFTRKGRISNFDHSPEFLEGDFFDLKDVTLGQGETDTYRPSPALRALCDVYKFWIAFADLDGMRVDTVKHMDLGAARFFAAVIHEFAQSLGKENFYLIGEITGGRERAFDTLEVTGLGAVLGISDEPGKLEGLVKGFDNPESYFDLFRNSLLVRKDSHVWFRNKVVTILDDHDQVRKGENKARFCGDDDGSKLVLSVLALQTATLGIPCIYYGTEQGFDGQGGNDRFIREAMFGNEFGAFRSRDRHFFNENGPVYKELAKILAIRKEKIGLRRGRQYLRQISGNGQDFDFPRRFDGRMRSIVPWSRLFNDRELLLAINTDPDNATTAFVIVDKDLHSEGDRLRCIYSTDAAQIDQEIVVQKAMGGSAKAVSLTVPRAGFVIYE
jgi:glycosidase